MTAPGPLEVKGSEWRSFSLRRRNLLVRRAFEYWRGQGFPYYALGPSEVRRDFGHLLSHDETSDFAANALTGSNVGLRLANHFHPQMWSVRVSRYRSPMDVFQDDDLLLAALERAWTIWPDRYGARPSSLRRMLKSFPGAASVSNFRPTLARSIIARYSRRDETVVDFASGYGGRALGCISLQRRYIGIEPCREQILGCLAMVETLNAIGLARGSAVLNPGCAEDQLSALPSSSASLVLSSPPYYDWEHYSENPTQSFVRFSSYEEWLDGFLCRVIHECRRILRRGRHLIINISGKTRHPSRADVESCAKAAGFELDRAVPLLLARIPYLHPRSAGPYKPELLLIFRRR